jgi:hypothetical protein
MEIAIVIEDEKKNILKPIFISCTLNKKIENKIKYS